MIRILCAALMAVILATPAFAARVYLKEGGLIEAKRVWRSGGKVHVLATRDTLTSFENNEIDLKRTFPHKRRTAKKVAVVSPQKTSAAPDGTTDVRKSKDKGTGILHHALPKLPERPVESQVSPRDNGGSIKLHKKEMAEKISE